MDHRSEPRVQHEIRFFVHVNDCPDKPELVGVSAACEAIDFSIHGLQFHTEDQFPAGTTLNITIGIGDPFAMFLLSGECRWAREGDGGWYMGILLHDKEGTDYAGWCQRFEEIFS